MKNWMMKLKDPGSAVSYGLLYRTAGRERVGVLPIGYAVFHLPWVAEWYTAARQYRAAYELLRDFPVKVPLPR